MSWSAPLTLAAPICVTDFGRGAAVLGPAEPLEWLLLPAATAVRSDPKFPSRVVTAGRCDW
jgi:hypothetical protein